MPGKHFSGLTPSEQKALYVRLRSVHEKRISLYFTVHSVMGRRPTLYFTVLSVMGRRPTPSTECGPKAHTLCSPSLSEARGAHSVTQVIRLRPTPKVKVCPLIEVWVKPPPLEVKPPP